MIRVHNGVKSFLKEHSCFRPSVFQRAIYIEIEEICKYTSHENVCVWKQNAPLENLLPNKYIMYHTYVIT